MLVEDTGSQDEENTSLDTSASTSGVSTPQQTPPTSDVASNVGTGDSVSGEAASSSLSANT